MVSLAIMAVLAGIAIMSFAIVKEKANRVACTGNLKALHACFTNYVQDKGHWPQAPAKLFEQSSEDVEFYSWIISELLPYDGERYLWMCPAEERKRMLNIASDDFVGSYVPTTFDAKQDRPWEWAKQPWLIERANNHRDGALLVLPDGSVHTVNESVLLH